MDIDSQTQSDDTQSQEESRKDPTNLRWTEQMSRFFVLFMAEQARRGLKLDTGFKNTAITATVRALNEAFPGLPVPVTEIDVNNHLCTLRARWEDIKKLKDFGGVSWDENEKMIIMGEAKYHTYSGKCKHKSYLNRTFDLHDELLLICGNDQATGIFSRSFGGSTSQSIGKKMDDHAHAPVVLDSSYVSMEFDNNDTTELDQTKNMHTPSPIPTYSRPKRSTSKRTRETYKDIIADVVRQIREVAVALEADPTMELAGNLYTEVMAMQGYTGGTLCRAYNYLLSNETIAKGFITKNIAHRRVWMDEFMLRSSPFKGI